MPSPDPEALRLGAELVLALAERPRGGMAGDRLGRGTGSSLEFEDRRDYASGDDVRHLDWRAYARTDQLLVRVYREEVLPRVDLLIDASRSVGADPAKAQRAIDVVAVLAEAARAGGAEVRALALGDEVRVVPREELVNDGLEFEGVRPLDQVLAAARGLLRPGAVRVCVSDLLVPAAAAEVVRPLAAGAGGLGLVQVLGAEDQEPPAGRPARIVDAETGEALDLVLDARVLARYRERLEQLCADFAGEARRAAAALCTISATGTLAEAVRGPLLESGLVALP